MRRRLGRRLCRARPVARQRLPPESRGVPGPRRFSSRSGRGARSLPERQPRSLRIPQARNLHRLERARLLHHRPQRAATLEHSPRATGPPSAIAFLARGSTRRSSPQTPICVPTTWRSRAATANSRMSASALPRTSRPTPSAGRWPATAVSAPRSWLRLCAESAGRERMQFRSYRVICCGEGIGSMAEVADGMPIKASWPGSSRPSTKAQRIYAGKREKPCDRPPSCRSRRGGTRSCGGPAWMTGTSPAMTARVLRTNSKPVDQQIMP